MGPFEHKNMCGNWFASAHHDRESWQICSLRILMTSPTSPWDLAARWVNPGEKNQKIFWTANHRRTIAHLISAGRYRIILKFICLIFIIHLQVQPPSPFLIIANKILKGPVILNIGGKKWALGTLPCHEFVSHIFLISSKWLRGATKKMVKSRT